QGACDMTVQNRTKTTTWNISNPFAVPRANVKEIINPATDNSYGAYNIPTYSVGDTVEYQASFDNLSNALIPLDNPDAVDILPVGLELIPGSFTWVSQLPGMPNPIETVTENYNGTENTALRWSWKGASAYSVNPGDSWTFRFKVRVTIETAAGQIRNIMRLCCWDNTEVVISSNSCTDTFDINEDGDTTDRISCSNSSYGRFNNTAIAGLESAKWVKGQDGLPNENNVNANPCQDIENGFTRYPCNAVTVPGGVADYKLFVWNPGNVPMTDIVVIDILPHIGDTEVLEESIPRNTDWSPILVGAVTPPSGVTVYYSTETNPCRPEVLSPDPAVCQAPNWSITPPTDITQVKSLKFDFGSLVLNAEDTLELSWPMRTPTNAPNNGEIAWNSFAYAANRADNNQALLPSEPIKVGIVTMPVDPAVYGDFVWLDTNMNGIQDLGEMGISGVRVGLYQDNGDNISDPSTDLFVNFTMTGDDGKYLFPNLPSGDYYAVFSPPSGYTVSPSLQGGDPTLDSEGLIAAVTTLNILEDDRSWDLGIFPSPDCDITIANFTVSDCEFDGNTNSSSYDVSVFVNWSNEPISELIEVNIAGNIQTIDPSIVSSPAMLTFNLTADGSSQDIEVNFETTLSCRDNKNYIAPLPCDPAICAIGIIQYVQSGCNDNETNANDLDDYFTLTLSAASENASAQYEVVISANLDGTGGTVLGTTNYNTQITIGGGANGVRGTFSADGTTTYTITIRDAIDNTCFETITTQTVDSCNSPCTKCGRVSVLRN
ncbi:MAG: SdrD B-like domain-containing protein, partial [Chitinophagales bacterium]